MMIQAPEASWEIHGQDDDGLGSTVKSMFGGDVQHVDVRQRMFAILERDRDDSQ